MAFKYLQVEISDWFQKRESYYLDWLTWLSLSEFCYCLSCVVMSCHFHADFLKMKSDCSSTRIIGSPHGILSPQKNIHILSLKSNLKFSVPTIQSVKYIAKDFSLWSSFQPEQHLSWLVASSPSNVGHIWQVRNTNLIFLSNGSVQISQIASLSILVAVIGEPMIINAHGSALLCHQHKRAFFWAVVGSLTGEINNWYQATVICYLCLGEQRWRIAEEQGSV